MKHPRPRALPSLTTHFDSGEGEVRVTVTWHYEEVFEVFVDQGSMGSDQRANAEALGRLISLWLRQQLDVEYIIEELEGIGGVPTYGHLGQVMSLADGVAKALRLLVEQWPYPWRWTEEVVA